MNERRPPAAAPAASGQYRRLDDDMKPATTRLPPEELKRAALQYHAEPHPGKLAIAIRLNMLVEPPKPIMWS